MQYRAARQRLLTQPLEPAAKESRSQLTESGCRVPIEGEVERTRFEQAKILIEGCNLLDAAIRIARDCIAHDRAAAFRAFVQNVKHLRLPNRAGQQRSVQIDGEGKAVRPER